MTNKDFVLYFKAMADETRLEILQMLTKETLCACHILEGFDITQPTLSYHMKILVESGLVDSVKDGNWTRYSINPEIIQSIKNMINKIDTNNKVIKPRCL